MNWQAVVSLGVYPDNPPTNAARAAYAVSYGLLDAESMGEVISGFIHIRIDMEL